MQFVLCCIPKREGQSNACSPARCGKFDPPRPLPPTKRTHSWTTKRRPHEYIYGKYGTSPRLTNMYACPPYLEHPFSSMHRIKLIRRMIESSKGDG